MSFRLVRKSVTLNDLERRNGVILRCFSEFGIPGALRKSSRSLSHLMSSCLCNARRLLRALPCVWLETASKASEGLFLAQTSDTYFVQHLHIKMNSVGRGHPEYQECGKTIGRSGHSARLH